MCLHSAQLAGDIPQCHGEFELNSSEKIDRRLSAGDEIYDLSEIWTKAVAMLTYQMDLLSANGTRNCLLAIMCGHDLAAIVLARSLLRMNKARASRVVVWRGDELVFEDSLRQMLN